MKKLPLILSIIVVMSLPLAGGCGRVAPTNLKLPLPIGHPTDVRFENCLACHAADQLAATKPLAHAGQGYTNKDCLTCHKPQASVTAPTTVAPPPSSTPAASTPPAGATTAGTGTTSAPPTTTATAPTVVSTPAGKTLPATPVNPDPSIHPAAYASLCLMCHGPGTANQFPLPPAWDGTKNGSVNNPGTFTVAAGSTADHTTRTDTSSCLTQAGCHKLG